MKKTTFSLLIAMSICSLCSFAQTTKPVTSLPQPKAVQKISPVVKKVLLPFMSYDSWLYGYKDSVTNKTIIKPSFKTADEFSEGLALVSIEDTVKGRPQYGFIDNTGKIVIPLKYDDGASFDGGLAVVNRGMVFDVDAFNYVGGLWGFVDKTGKEVVKLKYQDVSYFSDGLAMVQTEMHYDTVKAVNYGGLYGYIDKTGKEVIKPKYDEAEYFDKGMASVAIYDTANGIESYKYGIINLSCYL